MEINENPNFDELEKLLKDNLRSDFIEFISSDKSNKSNSAHFVKYNSCLKALLKKSREDKEHINLLQSAIELQSTQIQFLMTKINENDATLKEIKKVTFFGFRLF